MSPANIWAVVPVKPFKSAKRRLAGVLAPAERVQLARLMAEDVLDVLDSARHLLAGILVVTADAQATALARGRGAQVLIEPSPAGINRALAYAADRISDAADSGLIFVPTDLPHITAAAIADLTRHLAAPRAVALIAATGDGGTNLLAVRPAGIIRPSFGPDSFARHRVAAHAAGIVPTVLASQDLGCDIDRPDDLEAFLSLRTATRTHAFLASRNISRRLTSARHNAGMQSLRIMR